MNLIKLAEETLSILDNRGYIAQTGHRVLLDLTRCVLESRTWRPDQLAALVAARQATTGYSRATVEVTHETTAAAARRLAMTGADPVLALNFASAVSVGGGFLRGARAQEEDLCRCSALYRCLEPQREYYAANRAARTDLYTDHMIVSPRVPFFRDDWYSLLKTPVEVSILTAPAPCARDLRDDERAQLPAVFERRVAMILALAAELRYRRLVLGAWGCGAFRNDPGVVADVFARRLADPAFACFERVVFAIFDETPEQRTLAAFRARLGG